MIGLEAAGLVRHDLIARAEELLRRAESAHSSALAELQGAEAALEVARRAPAVLLDHAAGGACVSGDDIDQAAGAAARHEQRVAFRRHVVERFVVPLRSAQAGLVRARDEAWRPALEVAARQRIAAAVQMDQARGSIQRRPDRQAVEAAQAAYDAAGALMREIQQGCGLLCNHAVDKSSTTADLERLAWARILGVAEAALAA